MSERVSLTFACTDEAQLARTLDRAAAVGATVVEVRSSSPLSHGLAARIPTRASRVPLFGIFGGAVAGLAAYLIATFTATAHPMITGHMPIVAAPPVGIITYEGIALGAVLFTTLGVMIECRLPRAAKRPGIGARVARGELVVTIEVPDDAKPSTIGELIDSA